MWELSTRYLVKGEVLGLELIEDRRSGQTCFSSDDNPTARASRAVTSLREQVDPYALHRTRAVSQRLFGRRISTTAVVSSPAVTTS